MPKIQYDNEGLPVGLFPGTGPVFGEGPVPCKWMFIGEAPGAGEDKAGRPFIGPSGRVLNKLLETQTELRRETVYVTNLVKHRPPHNRNPMVGERRAYLPFLQNEIRQVNPDVIVTLGGIALWAFNKDLKISKEHGRARLGALGEWSGVLVPWFHPAYAIRNTAVMVQLMSDAERLGSEVSQLAKVATQTDYQLSDERSVTAQLLGNWSSFGFDTETTSPKRAGIFQTDEADMVGYSVSTAPYSGIYIDTVQMGNGIAGVMSSPLWTKICHNAKFEYKILRKQGVELNGYEDTALAAYLLGEPQVGLKFLSRQHLGVQPITFEDVTKGRDMSEVPAEEIAAYAAADADHPTRLWPLFLHKLEAENLVDVYRKIEIPLVPILARMENRGIGVDVERCKEVIEAMNGPKQAAAEDFGKAVTSEGDEKFNINSADKLSEYLESKDAPLKRRTQRKQRLAVDRIALQSIRDWWPEFIDPLLDYRKFVKFMTYVDGFVALQSPTDKRLHTSFNQAGHWEEDGSDPMAAPSTGRLSSSSPNLANIPHHRAQVGKVDWGEIIRSCLVAAPGKVLMSIDLAQEEPRIVAVTANDETLMEGFINGRDIYRPATEALYSRTIMEGSDSEFKNIYDYERFVGKTFFLAWYYGAGAGRLKTLDKEITDEDAQRGIQLLKTKHPARDAYLDYIRQELYDHACISSLYGRKRWFWKAWSKRSVRKGQRWPQGIDWEQAVREGANMRIQATAADILKMAMVTIDKEFDRRGLEAHLVSTVYDEVVLELPPAEVTTAYNIVRDTFRPLLPGLDLEVEAKMGINWGQMETVSG